MLDSLPPGPQGRWRPTLRIIREPRQALQEWAERYGDPFFVHALNGPVVITGRADLIQQIFAHDAADYDAFGKRALEPILGAGSMLMLSGEPHRRERKLVMPMFHGERMRAYAGIMQAAAERVMPSYADGAVFSALDATTAISLEIIVRAIFGSEREQSAEQLLRLSRKVMSRSWPIFFFSPKLHISLLGLSPWDRLSRAKQELRKALQQEVRYREEFPEHREDILSLLMEARYEDGTSIEREHLFHELGTFLFAGHETTAIALGWALYHLHSNQDCLARLEGELAQVEPDKPESFAALPYMKAVISETLRLHPIVTEVLRVLRSPMQLEGWELPAGTAVAPAVVLAHYHPAVYPDPDRFLPERFLKRSYSSAEYLPFGGGHRRCAGAAFATYEMAIVLGTLLSNFSFELLESKPVKPVRRNITMGPASGIRLRLHAKSQK